MIKLENIDGRSAAIAYINDAFEPVEPADATLIKIIFEDGEIRFGVRSESDRKKMAWSRAREQAETTLKAWNEADHPRGATGPGTTPGSFAPAGGGAGGEESKPAKSGKGKKKAKVEDFDKAKIPFTGVPADKFIEKWNDDIGMDPEEFKTTFLGGQSATMRIELDGDDFNVQGAILDEDGDRIGDYKRRVSPDKHSAYSAFFELNDEHTGGDIGKKVLAGNVEMYEQLGINEVKVNANIDVGGYAWAKYGYVPDQVSWNTLRNELLDKVGGGSSTSNRGDGTIEADEWDQLSGETQDNVRREWMRQTRHEFISSEEQSWRDSGQAKNDAKVEMADEFTNQRIGGAIPDWAEKAFDGARKIREERGEPPIPYTNKQLFDAMNLDYKPYQGDGEDDPEISFDDDLLKEPEGYDPAQQTLPGIEEEDPSQRLTEDMRNRLTKRMRAAFDAEAEDQAHRMDAPSYLADSVDEYQADHWESQRDNEKLQHAIEYDMANIEIERDEDEELDLEDRPAATEDPLLAALRSSDPKSIWKVSDTARGKELLLDSGWKGTLNLKDPESMKRFKEYVGRKKKNA